MKKMLALLCLSSLVCLAGSRKCDRCGRTTDGYMYDVGFFKKYCSSCHSKYLREESQEDGFGFGTILVLVVLGGGIVAGIKHLQGNKNSEQNGSGQ